MKFQSTSEAVLKHFSSTINGLGDREVEERLTRYGPNEIRRDREIAKQINR